MFAKMECCPDSLLSSAEVGGAPVAIVNRTYFEFNRGALRSLSEIGVLYCTCGRCYLFLEQCRVVGERGVLEDVVLRLTSVIEVFIKATSSLQNHNFEPTRTGLCSIQRCAPGKQLVHDNIPSRVQTYDMIEQTEKSERHHTPQRPIGQYIWKSIPIELEGDNRPIKGDFHASVNE